MFQCLNYRAMAMSADHSYIIAPQEYDHNGYFGASIGLPEGQFLRLGICFPLNSTIYFDQWNPSLVEWNSMDELMDDTTGLGYFIDNEVGVVFRMFKGHPRYDVSFKLVVYTVGSDDVNCIERAYPKYQTDPMKNI